MAKSVLKGIGTILAFIGIAFGIFLLISTIMEYRPADTEALAVQGDHSQQSLAAGDGLSLMSFNIGYAGLGENEDFFMDGGNKVQPDNKAVVEGYLTGVIQTLEENPADVYFIQEADVNSQRSFHLDEAERLGIAVGKNAVFAYNYKSLYVPYPLPNIGKVESGLLTLTDLNVQGASRISLPVPFSWPVRMFNLKRCLLLERIPLGSGRELVLINLHLEAYDDGEGKKAQTERLMNILIEEYEKGNYVIAGGDFNQIFPDAGYPLVSDDWQPGTLNADMLPAGWQFAYDPSSPTCRLLNQPFNGDYQTTQLYVIDGFILSPNIQLNSVETLDLQFANSDHNPVRLQVTLTK